MDKAKIEVFDMAFLRTISFRQSSDKDVGRTTIHDWMSDLTEAGYLRKNTRGQWFRADVGFVETVENTNCHLSVGSPTPVGRGDRQRPVLQTRKRAKRRA